MPSVCITGGVVRGVEGEGVVTFRGMPFARAPVGAHRFAEPAEPTGWAGVRDATSFGPPPPQAGLGGAPSTSGTDPDEWLTLNVWTPGERGDDLPVMVWIHGGGYAAGSSANPTFDGRRLARDGHVVVVTFNYRVGFEGYGLLEGAPANRGLLDQAAALRWVNENIQQFGGNIGDVTVFGQSAGGGSLLALLSMPNTRQHISRAVLQSVPRTFLSAALGADIADEIGVQLGRKAERGIFATLDPHALAATSDAVTQRLGTYEQRWGHMALMPTLYSPVIDGAVLTDNPWDVAAAGTLRDIPLLVGHTRNEHRLFMALRGLLGAITDDDVDRGARLLAPTADADEYRSSFPDATPDDLYELIYSDWLFRMPSLALAEMQAAAGGSAHMYVLTQPVPRTPILGAPHGADVPLIFGNFGGGSAALTYSDPPSSDVERLGVRMRSAWTDFAHSGSPGWPRYTEAERLTMLFDTPLAVTRYPEERSRSLHAGVPLSVLDLPGASEPGR